MEDRLDAELSVRSHNELGLTATKWADLLRHLHTCIIMEV